MSKQALTPDQLDRMRTARWKARTDLLWLCNNVLGFKDVNPKVHGGLINVLQKFPKPTKEQFEQNDRLVGRTWVYEPVKPLKSLLCSKRTLILDFRGSLKCHTADQLCRVADGTYKRGDSIRPGDVLFGVDEKTFEQKPVVVEAVEEQAPQECFEVKFLSGRVVKTSHHHPYKTVTGWKKAEDLSSGDRIALLGAAAEPAGAKYMPDAALLGWLIGDGCFTGMVVTNERENLRDQIIAAAKRCGVTAHTVHHKNRTASVRIQGYRPRARALGLLDSKSGDRFVPDELFRANNRSVREFLHSYLMCDGTLKKHGISYTTKSERLARDIQRLFLRFNVFVKIQPVTLQTGPYKGNVYWFGHITSTPMVRRALAVISWDKPSNWNPSDAPNPNFNTVPKEWRGLYGKYFFKHGEKPSWLVNKYAHSSGDGRRKVMKSLSTYSGRKEYLYDVGVATNDDFLQRLGSDEIFWDTVISVTPIGKQITYAIQTSEQNYAIDDIITHNTSINIVAHTIQWILNYPDVTILIVQANTEKAMLFLKEIKSHFIGNPVFRDLFPEHCPQKKTFDWGTQSQFTTEARSITSTRRESTVMTASIDKGVAGMHFDILKFSDIVEENNSRDVVQSDGVYYNFNSMFNLLVAPPYWIDVEGTRYSLFDTYGQIIDKEKDREKRSWDFYINGCFERDSRGDPRTYGPEELDLPYLKDEDGQYISRWPDRFPVADLLEYQRTDPRIFSCQQLNAPVMSADGKTPFPVNDNLPKWISQKDFRQVRVAYREIVIDTAETMSKRSDYSAITVGAWDTDGRLYIEQIYHGKYLPDELVKWICFAVQKHKPMHVNIEETSFVRGLKNSLGRSMHKLGLFIPIRYIKRDTGVSKRERILNTLQPWYVNGHIRFLDDIAPKQELQQELQQFPSGRHDDILDTLADFFQNKEYFGREGGRPATHEDNATLMAKQREKAWNIMTGIADPDEITAPFHPGPRPGLNTVL